MKQSLGLPCRFKLKVGSVPSIKAPTVRQQRHSTPSVPSTRVLVLLTSTFSSTSTTPDAVQFHSDEPGPSTSQTAGDPRKRSGGAYLKRERARTEPEQAKLKKPDELGKAAKSKTSINQEKSAKKLKPIVIKLKKPAGLVTPAESEKVAKFKKSTKLKKPVKVEQNKLKTPTKLRTPTKSRMPVKSEEAAKLKKSSKLEKHSKSRKSKSKKLTKLRESVELETHAKLEKICAAVGCSHPRVKFGCTFYSFPKDKKLAKKWLRAAKCDVAENQKTVTQLITDKHLRLCNCHFEKRPNPKNKVVPTIFFNATSNLKIEPDSKRTPQQQRKLNRTKGPDQIQHEPPKKSCFQENGFWKHYHQLREESSRYKEACDSLKLLTLPNVKDNDSVFEMYTGLPNYAIFKLLHDYLKPDAKELKPDPSQINEDAEMYSEQSLTSEEELFLFLVGSRTGNSVSDLAVRFGVSEETYRFIFAAWAVFVSSKLEDFYRTVGATDREATGVQVSEMCVAVDFTALFSNSPSLFNVKNQNSSQHKLPKLTVLSLNDKGAVTGVITMLDGQAVVKVAPNKVIDFTKVHNQFNEPPKVNANVFPKKSTAKRRTASLADIDRALDRIKQFSYLRQQVDPMELDIYQQVFKACAYLTNFQSAFRIHSMLIQ